MIENEDDLELLDDDSDLTSPLDRMEPLDDADESAKPDPDAMLPLLESPDVQQRMVAARAFCELQDERAIPALINLLTDACPLVRVDATPARNRWNR